MYLDEADVVGLLDGVREATRQGSTLLFTHLRTDSEGRPYVGNVPSLIRGTLALLGEPLKWGIRRDELAGFLSDHGYAVDQQPTPDELHERYLVPAGLGNEPVGDMEFMAVARTR